jgi:predicted glycosyltransferase
MNAPPLSVLSAHSSSSLMPFDQAAEIAERPRVPSDRAGVFPSAQALPSRRTVWIDLENSPHVPFFLPIKTELERRGARVALTARDCFQVCELADMAGWQYRKVGHHYGKSIVAKLFGLMIRVAQLVPFAMRERPAISISHGSRSQIVLSALMGIPTITMVDYEHADFRVMRWLGSRGKKWILTPEVISPDTFARYGILPDHVLHYPGIKEDVYVPSFRPDPSIRDVLRLSENDTVVTLRPPATEAHYHNPESEKLLDQVMALLKQHPETKTILLPRTPKQEAELRDAYPELFTTGRVMVPEHAVNGLDLIWFSDVVISGGGTMNREAAALGIPVYSFFRGKLGAVDRYLAAAGRLTLLQSPKDVAEKLKLVRRDRSDRPKPDGVAALDVVVDRVCDVLLCPA